MLNSPAAVRIFGLGAAVFMFAFSSDLPAREAMRLSGDAQVVAPARGLVAVSGRQVIVGRDVAAALASCDRAPSVVIEGHALASGVIVATHVAGACDPATPLEAVSAVVVAESFVSLAHNGAVAGIVGTGIEGIVGTGIEGIVGTGIEGIVGTGIEGIVGTGIN